MLKAEALETQRWVEMDFVCLSVILNIGAEPRGIIIY